MPCQARCVIGVCNNNESYSEYQMKHSDIKGKFAFRKQPTDRGISRAWILRRSVKEDQIL